MAKILCIDDEPAILTKLDRLLTSSGHSVLTAIKAKTGLRMAAWRNIDLIILDISMPDMNGVDMLRQLKGSGRTHYIPVIILSGYDMEQAYGEYAENYIVKGTPLNEMMAKIDSVLSLPRVKPRGTLRRWLFGD
jgi:DNA-binding response OmpR family regulator